MFLFSWGTMIFVKIVVFIPDLVALMLRVLMYSLWILYSCCFQCFPILIKVSRIILNWFVTQGKSALQAIKCRKILGNKGIKIFVLILVMKNPLFIILLFLNTEVQFSNTIENCFWNRINCLLVQRLYFEVRITKHYGAYAHYLPYLVKLHI